MHKWANDIFAMPPYLAYPVAQTLLSVRNGTGLTNNGDFHLTRHFVASDKKASLIKGRFGGIVYVTEWRIRWHKPYFAYETARVSRITVIFTWPGYVISSWIFFAMSCDRLSASWSESLSAPTMTRSSRPAWMA